MIPDLQVPGQLVAERLGGRINRWIGTVCLPNKRPKVYNHSFPLLQHLGEDEAHHDGGGSTVDVHQPLHVGATHHVKLDLRRQAVGSKMPFLDTT